MCNRYSLHSKEEALQALAEALRDGLDPPDWVFNPRYNIAPGLLVPAIVREGDARAKLRPMHWGLIPYHERDKPRKSMWPNAKAETAQASPAFRRSTAKRRCLVPANGYYEWATAGKLKLPHFFTLRSGRPFAFAGIWEPGAGDVPASLAILTTRPNALSARIHDRMPVVLPADRAERWLGSEPLPDAEFAALTQPLPDELMAEREVNRYVNDSRNDGPRCLAAPDEPTPDPQLSLF